MRDGYPAGPLSRGARPAASGQALIWLADGLGIRLIAAMIGKAVGVLAGILVVALIVVFGFVRPFAGWDYAEVLGETQAALGKDRRVVAVEINQGTVAFVVREGKAVRVRHYSRHCALHDGDSTVNGAHREGTGEIRTRRQATFTRAATAADRGPTVPLGALDPDVLKRLEDAGMRGRDDPVFCAVAGTSMLPWAIPRALRPTAPTSVRPGRSRPLPPPPCARWSGPGRSTTPVP